METSSTYKEVTVKTSGNQRIWRIYIAVFLGAALLVPIIASFYGVELLESSLAVLLLGLCLYPTARYFANYETGMPTLAVLSFAYGVQYAVPIFTHDETILLANAQETVLNSNDIVAALVMTVIGLAILQLAYYGFQSNQLKKAIPIAHLHLNKIKAVCYCLAISLLLPLTLNISDIIPDQYQPQLLPILNLLQNQVLVIIGVLGWLIYSGRISKWFLVWLYGLVALSVMRGVAAGWLEQTVVPIAVLFVVKWLYTRRMPVMSILVAALLLVFLTPVKSDFREQYWYGDRGGIAEGSSIQRVSFWFEQATNYWTETFNGRRNLSESTSSVTGRTDLIHQLAHIYSLTPNTIPYQYGETYSYFAVTMIPRILWPDKPMVGSSNTYFAVTYGITTEEGVERSTFGVSLLGEGYINFGWLGVMLIMAFQGIVISILQHTFGEAHSGAGGQAVFLSFFVFFLNGIGSSAEVLFGNILQNLICGCVLLWWARSAQTNLGKYKIIGLVRPAINRSA